MNAERRTLNAKRQKLIFLNLLSFLSVSRSPLSAFWPSLFILSLFYLFAFSLAQPAPTTPPPDFSPQVFDVARELRCPVCQGESAAESNAGVAVEMRRVISEQLAQGKNKEEIKAFFVSRYGDWILYEPPRSGLTLWVWLSPLVGLGLLGYGLWRYQAVLKSRAKSLPSDVSDEEIARLETELNQGKP